MVDILFLQITGVRGSDAKWLPFVLAGNTSEIPVILQKTKKLPEHLTEQPFFEKVTCLIQKMTLGS